MWSLLLLAGAAQAAEQLMMAPSAQQAAVHRGGEEAQAPAAAELPQQWTGGAEYYYTPEGGYLHQRSDPYQGTPVQAGPWVTVSQGSGWADHEPFRGVAASTGFGVDSQSLITWGLGAIVLLLMVSTVVQIFQRVFPTVREMITETAGDARSLETMTAMAQFVLQAMDKYEKLNAAEQQ